MIVSRNTVIWSGVVAVILFAIINRVRLYVNSEIVLGKIERNFEKQGKYFLMFQYDGNTYIRDFYSQRERDEALPIKVLIPFQSPNDYVIFEFLHFVFIALLLIVFMSGGWILFLQSFYPNRERFFLFNTKKKN